ncbi:MAG: anhydro-N-acetylmuramic acid kinase [Oceanospirillaceae bacterium]|nr:anhydro-N-acetylmuramic acid kinase [Oceanospirillaceae bacterium]
MALFIGLMSGTSIDAVDAVLVSFTPHFKQISSYSHPIPDSIKQRIFSLAEGHEESIDALAELDRDLGELFAEACLALMEHSGQAVGNISAIGSHGQTIRHRPEQSYTLQIGDSSRISERTGITTVADFRRRDVAAGGQGAPLVPAFHQGVFHSDSEDRVVINIGGMANLTGLPKNSAAHLSGFDTGPGNVLMDGWIKRHRGCAYDKDGLWAQQGQINTRLLEQLLSEPFFKQSPPKSTGRELFHQGWLDNHLQQLPSVAAEDVQATLTELTAISIAEAVKSLSLDNPALYLCGGGAYNPYLNQRIQAQLPALTVKTTAALGIEPDWVEAAAFAWLASMTLTGQPGNIASATGARGPRVLGAIYPA